MEFSNHWDICGAIEIMEDINIPYYRSFYFNLALKPGAKSGDLQKVEIYNENLSVMYVKK